MFFDEAVQKEAAELMLHFFSGLTVAEQTRLLIDWESGKNRIAISMKLKTDAFGVLPLKLAGLGHYKTSVARRCAAACLAQFQRVPAAQRVHMHHLTREIMMAGSEEGDMILQCVSVVVTILFSARGVSSLARVSCRSRSRKLRLRCLQPLLQLKRPAPSKIQSCWFRAVVRSLLCDFRPGTIRNELVAFVRGADMAGLPHLRILSDAFLFLPNVEIGIERLHSYVSQRLKIVHNSSPAYVSTVLRKAEIIRTHTEHTAELLASLELVPDRRQAVAHLGLQNHPCFFPYRDWHNDGKLDACVPHGLVNKVAWGLGRELTVSVSVQFSSQSVCQLLFLRQARPQCTQQL